MGFKRISIFILYDIIGAMGGFSMYYFLNTGWTTQGFNIFYGMITGCAITSLILILDKNKGD